MFKDETIARIFVASSTRNKAVARAFADGLESRGFESTVWDEWVFEPNESTFDGLLRVSKEYHYAVVIWGSADLTTIDGESVPSPRETM